MKRLICAMLAACLLLCGCAAAPAQTTAPAQTAEPTVPAGTTVPVETAAPGVDNDMSYQDQDLPIADEPAETTAPTEPTAPAFQEYTVRIEDPEKLIYCGAAFVFDAVALIEEAGVYTIVEEAFDGYGNLWGRLKSGAGWIRLRNNVLSG